MRKLFVTVIAVGVSLLVGCSTEETPQPGPITEAEGILGTWEVSGSFVQYNEDGTFQFAESQEMLNTQPLVRGEYGFENGHYFEKEIEVNNIPACGDIKGIYDIELLENGNLMYTVVEDACQPRALSSAQEHKRVK